MPARQDPSQRLGLVFAGATGSAAGTTPAADRSSANVVISSELVGRRAGRQSADAAVGGGPRPARPSPRPAAPAWRQRADDRLPGCPPRGPPGARRAAGGAARGQGAAARAAGRGRYPRRRGPRRLLTELGVQPDKVRSRLQAVSATGALPDRRRVRLRAPQRAALHCWSFHQLGMFIDDKARQTRTCPSQPARRSELQAWSNRPSS
jgi:hypothetical protein